MVRGGDYLYGGKEVGGGSSTKSEGGEGGYAGGVPLREADLLGVTPMV